MMKTTVFGLAVLCLAGAAAAGTVGTATFTNPSTNGAFYFTVNTSGGDWTGSNPFDTFCLEKLEYMTGQYYTLSTDVIDNDAANGGEGGGPLQIKVAWLYDYYLTHPSEWSGDNRNLVQDAIWALQGEITLGYSNSYYNKADSDCDWLDLHGYGVMNTWTNYDPQTNEVWGHSQDVLTPIPEPLTMASAFMAISGLGVYLRRRTALKA